MGDVIQVLDEFIIQRCERDDGREHTFEMCIIYPDYMHRDNFVIDCDDENESGDLFTKMLQRVHQPILER